MLIFTGPVLILLSQPPFYESLIKILPVDTVFGAALLTEKSRGSHTLAHQNKLGSPSLSPNPWHPNWGLGIFSCHHCSGHCEAHHSLRPNELDQPKGQILPLPIFVNKHFIGISHTHHFCTVSGCSHASVAQLSSCDKPHMAHRPENIYCLAQ